MLIKQIKPLPLCKIIDVRYLLPDPALAGADGTHPLQQFAEVVFAEHSDSLFQPIVVKYESLADILVEYLGGPLAKSGRSKRGHAVAYSDNGVKTIKGYWLIGICNLHFLQTAFFIQFTTIKDITQMTGNAEILKGRILDLY